MKGLKNDSEELRELDTFVLKAKDCNAIKVAPQMIELITDQIVRDGMSKMKLISYIPRVDTTSVKNCSHNIKKKQGYGH